MRAESKTTSAELTYPSQPMLQMLLNNDVQVVAAPRGKSTSIRNPEHAVGVACAILEASFVENPAVGVDERPERLFLRALNQVSDTWQTLFARRTAPNTVRVSPELLVSVLDCIIKICSKLVKKGPKMSWSSKSSLFLRQCVEDLTRCLNNVSNSRLQRSLLELLLSLLRVHRGLWRPELARELHDIFVRFSGKLQGMEDCPSDLLRLCNALTKLLSTNICVTILKSLDAFDHDDVQLQHVVVELAESPNGIPHESRSSNPERPLKRRKQDQNSPLRLIPVKSSPLKELDELLRGWPRADGADAVGIYSDLETSQQARVLELLGTVSCENAQHIIQDALHVTTPHIGCMACGGNRTNKDKVMANGWSDEFEQATLDFIGQLVTSETTFRSPALKVLATLAIRQVAAHTYMLQNLNLSQSSMGRWCLSGLRSSSRDLRLSCAQALKPFLDSKSSTDDDLSQRNRMTTLNVLRSLAQTNDQRISDSLIFAFGQVALVCTDEEMNLVLLELVEFLGSSNTLQASLAFLELQRIAETLHEAVEELLRPYWRTIAIAVVKDLRKKPQKIQLLADALGWTVDKFLCDTQTYTLPYLILWGQVEIIQRVVKAHGSGGNISRLCLSPTNLPAILAMLLSEHPSNAEAVVAQCMKGVKVEFEENEVVQWFKYDVPAIARDILLIASNSNDEAQEKVSYVDVVGNQSDIGRLCKLSKSSP